MPLNDIYSNCQLTKIVKSTDFESDTVNPHYFQLYLTVVLQFSIFVNLDDDYSH